MDEKLLFRMNFILQDNSGTTLEANLVKFIECVLLDQETAVSIEFIKESIENEYQLEFSVEEIEQSIKKKGTHILNESNTYFLEPKYRNSIRLRPSINDELTKYVTDFIRELKLDVDEDAFLGLIKKYLYHCFNTNKDTLLSLINHKAIEPNGKERFTNDEIKQINSFLQWQNNEKDECITKIISYCYVYCSLTVKKDNLLSNKLFRGKKFLLDANIIFRLAGINNDSRRLTISSFISKCKQFGIELCYTDETLDEVYRVISNKTKWIMHITGGMEPVDVSEFEQSENDFYKLYRLWCDDISHTYSDYEGFQKHLLIQVTDVLDELRKVYADNYEIIDKNHFDNYYKSLENYKNCHTTKMQSKSSLRTDVNNVMHILRLRKKAVDDLWSVAEFLISADQNLINWSTDVIKGVPVVVLPSVWLTIMLRFTGRQTSSDDYKAFCSFLELRQHIAPDELDVYSLIEKLPSKTNSISIKKRIISEVLSNKEEYKLDNLNGYDEIIDRAFDKIVDGFQNDEMRLKERLEEAESDSLKKDEMLWKQKKIDDQQRIQKLVDIDTDKRFRFAIFYTQIDIL